MALQAVRLPSQALRYYNHNFLQNVSEFLLQLVVYTEVIRDNIALIKVFSLQWLTNGIEWTLPHIAAKYRSGKYLVNGGYNTANFREFNAMRPRTQPRGQPACPVLSSKVWIFASEVNALDV